MYKLSRFNYYCKNGEGDLLLFNCYNGLNSTCKIKDKAIQETFLENPKNLSDNLKQKLMQKGILISQEVDEDFKLRDLIYENIAQSFLELTISPTEGCNFRCKYCYESHDNLRMTDEVKENLISFVKKNVQNYTRLHVSWFGGEPLLSMGLVQELSNEFIKICKFHRRPYASSMTTNGYLLDLETFKKLLECKINAFQITIDGVKSIHDYQRPTVGGGTSFDRIYNNLIKIKGLRNRNFKIVVRSNVTREIFNHLDEYLEMISSLCEDDDRFLLSITYVVEWSDNIDKEFRSTFLENLNSLEPIYQKILDSKKKIQLVFPLNPKESTCHLGRRNAFFIRPNGEIHKCTILFEDSKNIIGHLVNGKLELNDVYYTKLLNPDICDELNECFYAPLCKGEVCPSKRENQKTCPNSKSNLSYYLQLLDNYRTFEVID